MEEAIKVGDVVTLKGSDLVMTVVHIEEITDKNVTFAECAWFRHDLMVERTEFNVLALKKAPQYQ